MKIFVSLLLLAGITALATPVHAQQAAAQPTADHGIKPAMGQQASSVRTASAKTTDTKITWQQRRAIKRKKLTPYAEAMLHNDLLREEPAKKNDAGTF